LKLLENSHRITLDCEECVAALNFTSAHGIDNVKGGHINTGYQHVYY